MDRDSDAEIQFLGFGSSPASNKMTGAQARGDKKDRPSSPTAIVLTSIVKGPVGAVNCKTETYYKGNCDVIYIGRASNNANSTNAKERTISSEFRSDVMSRQHAKIAFYDDGSVCITDLNSHHGTFVMTRESFLSSPHEMTASGFRLLYDNGKFKDKEDRLYKRIKPYMKHKLEDGDEIRFGKDVIKENKSFYAIIVSVKLLHLTPHRSTSSVPTADSAHRPSADIGTQSFGKNDKFVTSARDSSNDATRADDGSAVSERRFVYIPTPNVFAAALTSGRARNRFGLTSPSPPSSPSSSSSFVEPVSPLDKTTSKSISLLNSTIEASSQEVPQAQSRIACDNDNSGDLVQVDNESSDLDKEDESTLYPGGFPLEEPALKDTSVSESVDGEETRADSLTSPEAERIVANDQEENFDSSETNIDDGDCESVQIMEIKPASIFPMAHDSSSSSESSMFSPSDSSFLSSPMSGTSNGSRNEESDMSISEEEDDIDDESVSGSVSLFTNSSHFINVNLPPLPTYIGFPSLSIPAPVPSIFSNPLMPNVLFRQMNSFSNIASTSLRLFTNSGSPASPTTFSDEDNNVKESEKEVEVNSAESLSGRGVLDSEQREGQRQIHSEPELVGNDNGLRVTNERTDLEGLLNDSKTISSVHSRAHESDEGRSSLFGRDFDSNCADDGASDGSDFSSDFNEKTWSDNMDDAEVLHNNESHTVPLKARDMTVPSLHQVRRSDERRGDDSAQLGYLNSSHVWCDAYSLKGPESLSQQYRSIQQLSAPFKLRCCDDNAHRASEKVLTSNHDPFPRFDAPELRLPTLLTHIPFSDTNNGSSFSAATSRNVASQTVPNSVTHDVLATNDNSASEAINNDDTNEDFYWTAADWSVMDSHHAASTNRQDDIGDTAVTGDFDSDERPDKPVTLPNLSDPTINDGDSNVAMEQAPLPEVANEIHRVTTVVTPRVSEPCVSQSIVENSSSKVTSLPQSQDSHPNNGIGDILPSSDDIEMVSASLHGQIDRMCDNLRTLATEHRENADADTSSKRKREPDFFSKQDDISSPKRQRIRELLQPLTEYTTEQSLADLMLERRRLRELRFKAEMLRRRSSGSGTGVAKLVAAAVVGGIATWSALAYL